MHSLIVHFSMYLDDRRSREKNNEDSENLR